MSKVESFNESGECFGVRYVRADADIITETSINYSDGVLREHKIKEYTGRMHTGTGIKIGNRLINYNISKCKYDNYDVYTEYKEISPYENMNLPITYAIFIIKSIILQPLNIQMKNLRPFLMQILRIILKKYKKTVFKSYKIVLK